MSKRGPCVSSDFVSTYSFLSLLAVLFGFVPPAGAATRTWDGSSSGRWNFDANWTGGVKPVNGDTLIFPTGASRLTTTNDILSLQLNSLAFKGTGYTLRGNALTVTGGIDNQAAGKNSISLAVTCAANQTFACSDASGGLYFLSNVVLNAGTTVTNSCTGLVDFSGVVSGGGKLVKTGAGTMALDGPAANTYTGSTTVMAGLLELGKANGYAVPGALIIGGSGSAATALELTNDQVGTSATVNGLGVLDLNGFDDYMGLTLVGGTVTNSGIGYLGLLGDLTCGSLQASSVSTISGRLSLGVTNRTINVLSTLSQGGNELVIDAIVSGNAGVGLIKSGGGTLQLNRDNTYTGSTTVNGGVLQVNSAAALGQIGSVTILAGGTLEVSSGLTITNEALVNNSATSTLALLSGTTPAVWAGTVTLYADLNVAVTDGNILKLSGVISGPGGLDMELPGELHLSGTSANTYSGTTTVGVGILRLMKSSGTTVSGPLIIGDGSFNSARVIPELSNQIGDVPVTINAGGLDLDSFGVSDAIGSLTLRDGSVGTGTGTLTLGGNLTNYGFSAVVGKLSLGGATRIFNLPDFSNDGLVIQAVISDGGASAGITQTGSGVLELQGANTYSGPTTVYGYVHLYNDSALGASGTAASGTVVAAGAHLYLDTVNVGNEFLTLQEGSGWSGTGSGSWAGPITLAGNATMNIGAPGDTYTLNGAISGPGGLTMELLGTVVLGGSAANTYSGTTYVNDGTLVLAKTTDNAAVSGPLIIGREIYAPNTAVVRLNSNRQINDAAPVTINLSGLLDLNGYSDKVGAMSGDGNVALAASTLLEVNADGSSSTFDGLISGAGSFRKDGLGTLILTANNTYTGPTAAFGGTLLVNGSQPQSPMQAYGTLGGSGTVGDTTVIDGKVAPGNSPGLLTCSNLVVSGSGLFKFELNGNTPGSGYDQLRVNGAVNLGNQIATLNVSLGYASALSNSFTIIDNDGSDAVTGTFNGLPQNATVNVSGIPFRISYTGGTGNDVVLTQLLPAPTLASVRVASTNLALSWPTNYAGFSLESKTNLASTVWTPVVPAPVINGTKYAVTNNMTGTQKFFRLRSP